MSGPYDFMYRDTYNDNPIGLGGPISDFIMSPIGIAATAGWDFFGTPRLLSDKFLKDELVYSAGYRGTKYVGLMNAAHLGRPGVGKKASSWAAARHAMLHGTPDELIVSPHIRRRGGGVHSPRAMGRQFGGAVAGRIGIARALSGASKFLAGWGVLEAGLGIGDAIFSSLSSYSRPATSWKRRELETGGAFIDTRTARSQRERALQAIHNSQLTTRAVLGNEAAQLHYR